MTTGLFFTTIALQKKKNCLIWACGKYQIVLKGFRKCEICFLPSLNLVTMIVAGKAIRTKAINTATEPHIYKEDREIIER